ncbi:hypothetical protein SeMB42_g03969 [Synchytrium endobioticum]|uniref:DNA topoisomerase n=1 Tax=Synchytrium endobioticum TaxID=286115 RepID=A0A507D227_9FUNG|nr:hypothetical protein SeMB42_g03969 [Synchytrium endobioticum]TPX51459.1 hypothetical protein SeLEV6574_g00274 [Synchytrium endobioticum]
MKVLCVAEKPSIAKSVAAILSNNQHRTRATGDKYTKNYDFNSTFDGHPCEVIMTAIRGHLFSMDFPAAYKSWARHAPISLFDAPTIQSVTEGCGEIARNLESEGRRADVLVIWTDCDREGENIGMEVTTVVRKVKPNIRVRRARFSVVQPRQIQQAWGRLGDIDLRLANAVDARIELDLRTGAAFTRFQTLSFQPRFRELANKIISFGSCQFPTLRFVVDRYRRLQDFVAEDFWRIDVVIAKDGIRASFLWSRDRLFDQHCCVVLYEMCVENPTARVVRADVSPREKWKPLPLNTVEMQKVATNVLRMSGEEIMRIAESLYNQGFLSYPRTETQSFDDNFELMPLIERQVQDPAYSAYAQGLLDGKFRKPRKGPQDDKAHPPIHPTKEAPHLVGNERRVYDFITRRFLACCSDDAKGMETQVEIDIAQERFTAKGLTIRERNFLDIYTFDSWKAVMLPLFTVNENIQPTEIKMNAGRTTPPRALSEADLITLMDKNGIGTDATIHEHIKKILDREYATKHADGLFYPTVLGMALIDGYDNMRIDLSLSKPELRRQMEENLKLVFTRCLEQIQILEQALIKYFGHAADGEAPPVEIAQEVRSCPRCDFPICLKTIKTGKRVIGCTNYPTCKNAVWLPESVTEVSCSDEVCDNCSRPNKPPRTRQLKFQFKRGALPPNIPLEYVTCIWCDEYLRECLTLDKCGGPAQGTNLQQQTHRQPHQPNGEAHLPNGLQNQFQQPQQGRQPFNNMSHQPPTNQSLPNKQEPHPPPPINNMFNQLPPHQRQNNAHQPYIQFDNHNNNTVYQFNQSNNYQQYNYHAFDNTRGRDNNGPAATIDDFRRHLAPQAQDNLHRCGCGMVAEEKSVSKDGANKGRHFLTCPKQAGRCKFFKFTDEIPGYTGSANVTSAHNNNTSVTRERGNSWRSRGARGRTRRGGSSSRGSRSRGRRGGRGGSSTCNSNRNGTIVDDADYSDSPDDLDF